MKNKLVSIIIPVYNAGDYLNDCLRPLLEQSYENLEIIFIIDKSPDNSLSIIKKYQKKDKRIKIIENKVNMGAGLARNEGLKVFKGDYLLFLDPDDLLANKYVIQTLVEEIEESTADAVRGNFQLIHRTFSLDNYVNKVEESYTYDINSKELVDRDLVSGCPSYSYTTYLFKGDIIRKNKIKFEDYSYYEDPLFLATYLSYSDKILEIPDIIYLYRALGMPKKNLTIDKIKDIATSTIKILDIYKHNNMKTSYKKQVEYFFTIVSDIVLSNPYTKEVKDDLNRVFDRIDYDFIDTHYKLTKNYRQFYLKTKIKQKLKRI